MPAHFFVPGPAEVAVGTGASKALQFLGHTREGVHVREALIRRPVITDIGGGEMPTDMLLIGKGVALSMQMVRFDPIVMQALMARYFNGVMGGIEANGIGTLLLAESNSIPIVVRSRYQGKAIFSNNLPGIRVLWGFLDQDHGYGLHTREQEHQLTFTGLTNMDPSTLQGTCWNTDMSSFPQVS